MDELPTRLAQVLYLYVQEHALHTPGLMPVWEKLAPRLPAACEAAAKAISADHEKMYDLYTKARGRDDVAAHLIAADQFVRACAIVCRRCRYPQFAGKLSSSNRPKGGWALYDDAMRTLSELSEGDG